MISGEILQTVGAVCGVAALLWRVFDNLWPRRLQRHRQVAIVRDAVRKLDERHAARRAAADVRKPFTTAQEERICQLAEAEIERSDQVKAGEAFDRVRRFLPGLDIRCE